MVGGHQSRVNIDELPWSPLSAEGNEVKKLVLLASALPQGLSVTLKWFSEQSEFSLFPAKIKITRPTLAQESAF